MSGGPTVQQWSTPDNLINTMAKIQAQAQAEKSNARALPAHEAKEVTLLAGYRNDVWGSILSY
jgi:hypothetical protein